MFVDKGVVIGSKHDGLTASALTALYKFVYAAINR